MHTETPNTQTQRAILEQARAAQQQQGYAAEIDLECFEAQCTANDLKDHHDVQDERGRFIKVSRHKADLRGRARGHYAAATRLGDLLSELPAEEPKEAE